MKQFTYGCLMILMLFGTIAVAQEKNGMAKGKSVIAAEFMANLADVEKKLVGLAEATPAEKYAWRPAKGVRSTGEVFAHLAGGTYFILSFAGVKPPPLDRDYEKKITDKAKIVEMMKASFAHVRKAAMEASDADLKSKADNAATGNAFPHARGDVGKLLREREAFSRHQVKVYGDMKVWPRR